MLSACVILKHNDIVITLIVNFMAAFITTVDIYGGGKYNAVFTMMCYLIMGNFCRK